MLILTDMFTFTFTHIHNTHICTTHIYAHTHLHLCILSLSYRQRFDVFFYMLLHLTLNPKAGILPKYIKKHFMIGKMYCIFVIKISLNLDLPYINSCWCLSCVLIISDLKCSCPMRILSHLCHCFRNLL